MNIMNSVLKKPCKISTLKNYLIQRLRSKCYIGIIHFMCTQIVSKTNISHPVRVSGGKKC